MLRPMNPLRSATVMVSDAAAAAARYVEWLGHVLVETGVVDPDLAAAWQAPACAGRRYAVVRPASGRRVDLRFVEADPGPGFVPLRSFGWAAIELCVQDVHATHARLRGGPFEVIGPPSANPGLPEIHPMQVRGPDGEIVYLTQVLQGGPGSGLPQARAAVDVLFIAVLACADQAASALWFSTQLGLDLGEPLDIPYRMLNRAFDLPADTLHRIRTASGAGELCLEFDQYPAGATARPRAAGQLPPGVALCTLTHPDLDAIPGPWLAPPRPREGAIYEGRAVGVLRSPEGALIEVISEAP
jgi:catechol 2,3-dioxygenase-like lactoylglutathione lyase family enzyme